MGPRFPASCAFQAASSRCAMYSASVAPPPMPSSSVYSDCRLASCGSAVHRRSAGTSRWPFSDRSARMPCARQLAVSDLGHQRFGILEVRQHQCSLDLPFSIGLGGRRLGCRKLAQPARVLDADGADIGPGLPFPGSDQQQRFHARGRGGVQANHPRWRIVPPAGASPRITSTTLSCAPSCPGNASTALAAVRGPGDSPCRPARPHPGRHRSHRVVRRRSRATTERVGSQQAAAPSHILANHRKAHTQPRQHSR